MSYRLYAGPTTDKDLLQATDASKAHVLERLQREVLKYRREACLRLLNSVLCRHHLVMVRHLRRLVWLMALFQAACMFHQWELIAKGQVLERRLLAECEYKLGVSLALSHLSISLSDCSSDFALN